MRLRWVIAPLMWVLLVTVPLSAKGPDIVLISLDTCRADRLAPWGGPSSLAPNLDALAAGGTAFTNCFAPAPLTLPSHATLLTGAFPQDTGLRDNGFGKLTAGVPTLAEVLAARGYATAAVVAAPVLNNRYGLSKGFSSYDDALGSADARTAEDVTDRALARIRAPRKGPLFLWVHYFDAHFPYTAPATFSTRFPQSPYNGAVAYVDSEVGRLVKALSPDTILAVVSDHGEALGEHGELTHGVFLFQYAVRVVCFLRGPGVPSGKVCKAPTSLADVARTLEALAGAGVSALRGEGANLLALSRGELSPRTFPMEAWPPFSQYRWHPLFGVTDGRYKWVRGRRDHLYDLADDPTESRDLAGAPPAGAVALKEKLPPPPAAAPNEGRVDPAILGLGYAPAPGGRFDPASLPDPYDKAATLQDIAQARVDLRARQVDKAVARLKTATERDSGNPAAWFEYGEALRRAGKYGEAVAAIDRSLAIAPEVYQAWTSKGHAFVAQGKGDEAARCYEKALAVEPDYIPALNSLSAYYLDVNQREKALALIERAVSSGIAVADTYLLRGHVRLIQSRTDDAAKDFETALRISDRPEATLKKEADEYMEAQLHADGERLYLEGIRRYPAYAPNYLAMGGYSLQAQQPDKALSYFKKALECDLDPKTRERLEKSVQQIEAALNPPEAR